MGSKWAVHVSLELKPRFNVLFLVLRGSVSSIQEKVGKMERVANNLELHKVRFNARVSLNFYKENSVLGPMHIRVVLKKCNLGGSELNVTQQYIIPYL